MKYTGNHGLKKPEGTDAINIEDLNDNMDAIDAALAGKLNANTNAVSASKLLAARTISLSGDVTGSVSFDGSANVSMTTAVVDDSHNHIISNVDGLQTVLDAKEALIKDATAKTSIVDSDTVPLSDYAASNSTKKITFANMKATLKNYFDTLYNYYVHPTGSGNNHVPAGGASGQYLKYSANGTATWATPVKADISLGNVDNTSDTNKPISTATQTALNGKASSSHTHTAGEVGALPLAGGNMTGNLGINNGGPTLTLTDTDNNAKGVFIEESSVTYVRNYESASAYSEIKIAPFATELAGTIRFFKYGTQEYKVYGEHNISISTAAPGSALAEGAQHQVY